MKTFSFVSCFKVCPAKVILGRDTYVIDMTSALSSAVKCRWYPSLALSFCTAKSSPGCIAFDPTQLRQEGTEEGWSHSFYSFGRFALSCSIKFLLQDYLQPVFPSNPHDLNKLFEHCDMFDSHLHDNLEMGHQSAWVKPKLRNCETMKSCFRQHIELVWQNYWHLLSPSKGAQISRVFSCECCFLWYLFISWNFFHKKCSQCFLAGVPLSEIGRPETTELTRRCFPPFSERSSSLNARCHQSLPSFPTRRFARCTPAARLVWV